MQTAYVVSIKYLYLYSEIFDNLLQCRFDTLFHLLADYYKLKKEHDKEDFAEKLMKELCLMGVLKFFMVTGILLKYQTQMISLVQPAFQPFCELMKYAPQFITQKNYFAFIKNFLEYFIYLIPDRIKAHKGELAQVVEVCEKANSGTYQVPENKGLLSFLSFSAGRPELSAPGKKCLQPVDDHTASLQQEDPNALEPEIIKRMSKIMKYRTIVFDQEMLVKTYHVKIISESLSYNDFETICAVNKIAIQELITRMQSPAESAVA